MQGVKKIHMINYLADNIANFFVQKNIFECKYKEVYSYGFATIISTFISYSLILAISIIFGMVWTCPVFLLLFSPLRKYSGGYHANSYTKCKLVFCISFVLDIMLLQYFVGYYNLLFSIVINFFSVITLILFSPVVPQNKELTSLEISKNRQVSIIVVSLQALLSVATVNYPPLSLFMALATLTVSISLIYELIRRKVVR